MEDRITNGLSNAAQQARALADGLEKAHAVAINGKDEALKHALAKSPLQLGEIISHLGRLFPPILRRPFQFVIATGQYNPNATADDDEYPDEPPAHFTICIQHAIRVIGGKLETFDDDDNLPDVLFERQTIGKWLLFCSHENSDPACVLEINDDRTAEIYDVNYWAGNVNDRRSRPLTVVALGDIHTGWQFIGPFRDEHVARSYASELTDSQVLSLSPPPSIRNDS